jgi:hypothetical protein
MVMVFDSFTIYTLFVVLACTILSINGKYVANTLAYYNLQKDFLAAHFKYQCQILQNILVLTYVFAIIYQSFTINIYFSAEACTIISSNANLAQTH